MAEQHRLERCPVWESHPDAILLVGRRQRAGGEQELFVHDLNPRAEALFGYEAGDVRGGPIERFVPSAHVRTYSNPAARGPSLPSSPVFRAQRRDGSDFPATVALTTLGPPDFLEMALIRDVTDVLAWQDGLPVATSERLDQLRAREAALEARRETMAQHLFAAGLAVQQLNGDDSSETDERLERAVAVLDEVMSDLMAPT